MSTQMIGLDFSIHHILILEKDVLYGTIIGEMLREGTQPPCRITLCASLAEGLVMVQKHVFDAILLDLDLDEEGWQKPIDQIRRVSADTPILMIAQAQYEAIAVQALQLGAQDYLIKGEFKVKSLTRAIRNASERQRLTLELEASLQQKLDVVERQFKDMIVKNGDGIIVVNRTGIVRYVNPKAVAFFGRDESDFLGRKFDLFTIGTETQEIGFTNDQGESIYGELQAAKIEWDNEPAYLVSIRDVTQRKENQQGLEQIALDLQAQNEDLDAYAHMVAHDIKAPLGVMVGFSAALYEQHRDLDAGALDRYLNNIYRSGRKAEAIINELLLLASVRQQKVAISPVDMGYVVSEVRDRFEHLIKEKGAIIHLPKRWPVAQGYAPWVEEVWANYVSNALKYGGEQAELTFGYDDEGTNIEFWIQDNGAGLDEDAQAKLFTQFPQINSVRVDGHGLGLSIVRRIIRRLGGEVGVRSELGQGSQFYFTLPKAS